MARPFAYELNLPDFAAINDDDVNAVLGRLSNSLRGPRLRLLSYINAIVPSEFEAVRRGHMARQTTSFGREYMEHEVRMLRSYLQRVPAWSMRHYLVTWGRPIQAMSDWCVEAMPPEPLPGDYLESDRYLRPTEPGNPFVTIMGSFEFRGVWSWRSPWASLVSQAIGPMIVCLDAVQISEDRIRIARQGLQNMLNISPNDPDAARLAQLANTALQSGDEFYEMRLLLMLTDTRLDRLEQRCERIRQSNENTLGLSMLEGQQAAALDYFTSKGAPILGTSSHSFTLGSALPTAFGGVAGVINTVQPDGVYFGFRSGMAGQPLGPLHWRLFSESNRAGHMGFLGMTGSGKTVSMSALLGRFRATEDVSIVLIEPMGNASKLAQLLQRDPGMHFYQLDWAGLCLNPMDWVAESLDVDTGLSEQQNHLKALLQVMLNRNLTNMEEGYVAQALRQVYVGLEGEALDDPDSAPRLELLCECLREFRHSDKYGVIADQLATEIDLKYVSGGYGRIFNRTTNLPTDYTGAHLFDAAAVAGSDSGNRDFQTILYYSMFSHFLRVARRNKQQGKKVRSIIAIDEYYALSRNEFLKDRLNFMVRTLRNLYALLWVAEQTLETFTAAADASLLSNIPYWLVFRQGVREAAMVPQHFGNRCPIAYAEELPSFQQGQCIAMLDQTHMLSMNLLGMEYEALVKGRTN